MRELKLILRSLIRERGFTTVVLLTLALGIGANSAIFSVFDGIALRKLSYPKADRLVQVWAEHSFSAAEFLAFREQSELYQVLALYNGQQTFAMSSMAEPTELFGSRVSPTYFELAGARPALGRSFTPAEEQPGQDRVVILSHPAWQRLFGADPAVLGRTVQLDGGLYTIVGVMAEDFQALETGTELWVPMTIDPTATDFKVRYARLIGRLQDRVTVDAANSELSALIGRTQEEFGYRPEEVKSASVLPLREALVGNFKRTLLLLLLAAGLVLLVACANIAHLQLARSTRRGREVGIRLALGVGRGQLLRCLLLESLVLALFGGALGLLVAQWGVKLLVAGLPASTPRLAEIGLDSRVVLFSLLLSLLSGVLFGLSPALRSTRPDLHPLLKDQTGSDGRGRRGWLSDGLVVAQVTLAFVLVLGAGLMVKSMTRLQAVDPGFKAEGLLALRLTASESRYQAAPQVATYYDQIVAAVRGLPGVESVAATQFEPLGGEAFAARLVIENQPQPADAPPHRVDRRVVTAGYFQTLKIPLRDGRDFDATDTPQSQPVAIVSAGLAERFWPGENPLGKRLQTGMDKPGEWITVIGVVGDVRNKSLATEDRLQLYRPQHQNLRFPTRRMTVVLRTAGDPLTMARAARSRIWSIDRDVPIARIRTMEQVVYGSVSGPRWITQLLAAFAYLALVLGAVSIYGIISYRVGQRTREIGLRMSLGASRRNVLTLVLGAALRPVVIGLGLGLVTALFLARYLAVHLYEVSTNDPATILLGLLVLGGVALLASAVPARRASRVDPVVALKTG